MTPDAPPADPFPPDFFDEIESTDGHALFAMGWHPEGEDRGHLIVTHGYGEHASRYGHLARAFVGAGFGVLAYDLRGHGRSDGRPAYVDSFAHYLDDLDHILRVADDHAYSGPRFLLGHSMGGAITALYAIRRRPEVQGVILSSPAIALPDPAWLQRLSGVIGRIAPLLPTIQLSRGTVSRNPAVVAHAEADPLNYHGRLLARTGAEIVRAAAEIRKRAAELTLPFLVLHGTADQLTDPAGSIHLYHNAAATDKTLELYDGFYHETFNEPERQRVLDDLLDWLDEHA